MNTDNETPMLVAEPTAVRRRFSPWMPVALLALLLAGGQWLDSRAQFAQLQQEIARQRGEDLSADQEARGLHKAVREQVDALQAQVGAIDERLATMSAQGESLRQLAQDLSRGREEAIWLEVEQAITLAGQQLQLAGNVPVALLALQSADARLARLDQARVAGLRKALTKDIARLNALPLLDVPGISLRLEQVILGVDSLPLKSDGRPLASDKQAPALATAWWQRLGDEIWQELKGLVRIQRLDKEELALLAPEQVYFLRENLKLRLLSARLALLARDQQTFRNEIKVAQGWLERHFIADDKAVVAARTTLKQMAAGHIDVEIPNLNESQAALRALRYGKEKR